MAIYELKQPRESATVSTDELEAGACARGDMERRAVLDVGGKPLTSDEAANLLAMSEDELERLRISNALLGLPTADSHVYPAWQFRDGAVLPGVAEALQSLPTRNPWMQAAFFLGTNSYLAGRSPLTELEEGHVRSVVHAAQAVGEHGAA